MAKKMSKHRTIKEAFAALGIAASTDDVIKWVWDKRGMNLAADRRYVNNLKSALKSGTGKSLEPAKAVTTAEVRKAVESGEVPAEKVEKKKEVELEGVQHQRDDDTIDGMLDALKLVRKEIEALQEREAKLVENLNMTFLDYKARLKEMGVPTLLKPLDGSIENEEAAV